MQHLSSPSYLLIVVHISETTSKLYLSASSQCYLTVIVVSLRRVLYI